MNELYQIKKMNQALDMWFEDHLLYDLFVKDTEPEYGKAARAAKKAEEAKAAQEAKEAQEQAANPLKLAIKKPQGKKGLNGQGFNQGKRRMSAFQ